MKTKTILRILILFLTGNFIKPTFSLAQLIAAGGEGSFIVCNDNIGRTCGSNQYGQIGDSTTIERHNPVQVSNLDHIFAITGGGHFFIALKNDSTVWAWGDNYYGQLGDGSNIQRTIPVEVMIGLGGGIRAIAGGGYHSLALKSDGSVWAWGYNGEGQLGDSSTIDKNIPFRVHGLEVEEVIAISGGEAHSLALKNDGTVWAWGLNTNGQLGDGTTINRHVPIQVIGLTGIVAIAAGLNHSVALKNDGTVWAWGRNQYGQLGDGTTINRTTPVQVNFTLGDSIVSIASRAEHTLAIKKDSTVWAWGRNSNGQIGDGSINDSHIPLQVNGLTRIIAISGGGNAYVGHSLALKNNGTIWSWGSNNFGQLGVGDTTDRHTPVQRAGFCQTITELNNFSSRSNQIGISPNPFSNSTTISFPLFRSQQVLLKIFDLKGQLIKSITEYFFEKGKHQIELNTKDVSAGVYLLQIQSEEFFQMKKLIVAK